MTRIDALLNWVFEIEEASAGVYKVTGTRKTSNTVELTGTNPDKLIAEARISAEVIEHEIEIKIADSRVDPRKRE